MSQCPCCQFGLQALTASANPGASTATHGTRAFQLFQTSGDVAGGVDGMRTQYADVITLCCVHSHVECEGGRPMGVDYNTAAAISSRDPTDDVPRGVAGVTVHYDKFEIEV